MAQENYDALEWDSEIVQESNFEMLPEGEYDFQVESYERARFAGSEKMSACPQANITLLVKSPETGNNVRIFDTLYLHQKAEWRLSQFFESIGLKKKGEPLKMNWNAVPGSTGRLKLVINKYTDKNGNARENNRVNSYLPKEQRKFVAGQF